MKCAVCSNMHGSGAILSEANQAENENILMNILYGWNLKRNVTNELTYKAEIHRHRKWTHGCREKDSWGLWEGHVHGAIFKTDNQQNPIVYHMELCSWLCASLDGRRIGGEWIHVYGRLSCFSIHLKLSAVSINYTPTQNAFCVKKKKVKIKFTHTHTRIYTWSNAQLKTNWRLARRLCTTCQERCRWK